MCKQVRLIFLSSSPNFVKPTLLITWFSFLQVLYYFVHYSLKNKFPHFVNTANLFFKIMATTVRFNEIESNLLRMLRNVH